MNCGDMVIVKSDDGVSAGGFRIDSCLLGGQFGRQKGGSGEENRNEESASDYAVPAGLALVMDKPTIPQALKTALARPGAMSMLDEDTFNALMDAVDPSPKSSTSGSSKGGAKKRASRRAGKSSGGRKTRRRQRR